MKTATAQAPGVAAARTEVSKHYFCTSGTENRYLRPCEGVPITLLHAPAGRRKLGDFGLWFRNSPTCPSRRSGALNASLLRGRTSQRRRLGKEGKLRPPFKASASTGTCSASTTDACALLRHWKPLCMPCLHVCILTRTESHVHVSIYLPRMNRWVYMLSFFCGSGFPPNRRIL